MTSVTIDEAKAKLAELIDLLTAEEELIITKDDRPVARLLPTVGLPVKPRVPGALEGTVTYMAPDFDAPLDEFREYRP